MKARQCKHFATERLCEKQRVLFIETHWPGQAETNMFPPNNRSQLECLACRHSAACCALRRGQSIVATGSSQFCSSSCPLSSAGCKGLGLRPQRTCVPSQHVQVQTWAGGICLAKVDQKPRPGRGVLPFPLLPRSAARSMTKAGEMGHVVHLGMGTLSSPHPSLLLDSATSPTASRVPPILRCTHHLNQV